MSECFQDRGMSLAVGQVFLGMLWELVVFRMLSAEDYHRMKSLAGDQLAEVVPNLGDPAY